MHRVGYASSVFHLPATTPSSSVTAGSNAAGSVTSTAPPSSDSVDSTTSASPSPAESAPSSSTSSSPSSSSSSSCGSDNELKMRSSRGSLPGFLRRSTAVYHMRSRNFARANLMMDCGHFSASSSGKRCCRGGGGAAGSASSTTSWSSRKTSSASSSSLASPVSTPSTSSSALSLADWWPISGLTASRSSFLHGTAAYEALAGGVADEDAVVGAFFGFYALPECPRADPADVSFLMDTWRRFTLTPDGEVDPQIVRYRPK